MTRVVNYHQAVTKATAFNLQKVFMSNHVSQSMFHPVQVLLLAFGIDLKRQSGRLRRLEVGLAAFFHLVWVLVTVNAAACFDTTDATYHAFTAIKYACSLASWWILYWNRDGLARLVDLLASIRLSAGAGEVGDLGRWIRLAAYLSVFIVFGPGVICCLKLLALDQYPMFFCPLHQAAVTDKARARLLHFWLLTGFNYVSRGLPFAVTLFYGFCCAELVRLARFLHKQADGRVAFMCLLQALMEVEARLSALVFLQFVNSFLEILRIETVVLMYVKGRWHFDIFVHSIYYAAVGGTSFLAMILGADQAQTACHACRAVLRAGQRGPASVESRLEALQLQVEYLQEARHIRLTAWGLFQVKRDLLLSIFALFISYGVLIAQITP